MTLVVLLTLFIAGLIVGFASGLVGIGGGILIVPLLYFFYGHPAWSGTFLPAELHTEVAHATSLFIVIPTAIWGARAYHKAGLVLWNCAIPIGIASALAAIAGVKLALILPAPTVKLAFGAFLLISGVQLLWRPKPEEGAQVRLPLFGVVLIGVAVGLLSGLLGIGGGAVASALLIYIAKLSLRQATATALAVVALTAVISVSAYVVAGLRITGMPSGSLGYIHVAGALPIMAGSVLSVRWGALVNQRMHTNTLKLVFSAFFIVLGLYLIGQNVLAR